MQTNFPGNLNLQKMLQRMSKKTFFYFPNEKP